MKTQVVKAEKNSKNIAYTVLVDGHIVGHAQERDILTFVEQQNAANEKPAEFKPYDNYFTLEVKVKKEMLRGFKGFETLTIGYSPDGIDLDGRGNNTFASVQGVCLTAHYEKPVAVKVVDTNLIVDTNLGKFQLVKRGEHYSIKKI